MKTLELCIHTRDGALWQPSYFVFNEEDGRVNDITFESGNKKLHFSYDAEEGWVVAQCEPAELKLTTNDHNNLRRHCTKLRESLHMKDTQPAGAGVVTKRAPKVAVK